MTMIHPVSCAVMPTTDDKMLLYMENLSPVEVAALTESDDAMIHRSFLTYLNDPEMYKLYQAAQRKYVDFFLIAPLGALIYVAAVTRFSFQYVGSDGPLFSVAFALLAFCSTIFNTYVGSRMIIHFTPHAHRHRGIYKLCEKWLLLCFKGRIEDVIGVLGTMTLGFYLLGRVWAGQCEDMTDIWATQTCNPFADLGTIPTDQVILLYLCPLIAQCALRGITTQSLIFSWILVLIFVSLASAHVGGWLQIWTIMYSIVFMNFTFMIERLMRVTFVQSRAMLAAVKLRSKHELDLLEISAENERKVKEKEISQLRSLMGNVAHDLKTPLHSIEADLEVLKSVMDNIPLSVLETARVQIQKLSAGETIDYLSVFDSLNASCKFMGMAINRSQDFMKASNNIALVPAMGTFDITASLSLAVSCMNHLQSVRTINVHPIDTRMCPCIISDHHWFRENLLCLLSNAIKYSDDGPIDVRVNLIDMLDSETELTYTPRSDIIPEPISRASEGTSSDIHSIFGAPFAEEKPERQRSVLITVEDSGIGVTEEARRNLFQPFKQAQRLAGGTGLGLYSLLKRVEALRGDCGVTDRTDGKHGSLFWFSFPYRPDVDVMMDTSDDILSDSAISEQILSKRCSVKPRRVLVIDDSLAILKVTSRLLKMNGHAVKTAANGSLGLKMLKETYDAQDFNMVLTDLQMPVMDGIESVRRFREFETEEMLRESRDVDSGLLRKRLLIVGMSANSDNQSKQDALDSGMDYFVSKPFSYQELKAILSKSI